MWKLEAFHVETLRGGEDCLCQLYACTFLRRFQVKLTEYVKIEDVIYRVNSRALVPEERLVLDRHVSYRVSELQSLSAEFVSAGVLSQSTMSGAQTPSETFVVAGYLMSDILTILGVTPDARRKVTLLSHFQKGLSLLENEVGLCASK